MSEQPLTPRSPKSSGAISLPPFQVDTSGWFPDGRPPGMPTRPKVPSSVKNLAPQAVEFYPARPMSIEIVVELGDGRSPEEAGLLAAELVSRLHLAAPELKLAYNPRRSRAGNGEVHVILTPQVAVGEPRLQSLVDQINEEYHGKGRAFVDAA